MLLVWESLSLRMLSVQPGVERQFARKKLLVHLDTLRALDASYPSGSAARTAGAPAPAASASIPERPAGTAFPARCSAALSLARLDLVCRQLGLPWPGWRGAERECMDSQCDVGGDAGMTMFVW